ncbi:MAG: NUDIX domain-containing protein, partial [Actinobacteria bacterium]|nr:NUDIX domain-containing protein [Actinomycetota bacterium]
EALEREMMEELELQVRAVRKVWDCPTEDGSMQLHWWEVQADGEIGTPDVSEIAEVRWCSVPEIESLSPTFDEDIRFFTEIWPALER